MPSATTTSTLLWVTLATRVPLATSQDTDQLACEMLGELQGSCLVEAGRQEAMSRQAAASSKTAAPTLASAMPRPTGDPGHDPRRRARALGEPCEPLAEGGVPGCARYNSAA